MLVNNSDEPLKWRLDVSKGRSILDKGVFVFVKDDGVPFTDFTQDAESRIQGEMQPGETTSLNVVFCPSKFIFCFYVAYMFSVNSNPFLPCFLRKVKPSPR